GLPYPSGDETVIQLSTTSATINVTRHKKKASIRTKAFTRITRHYVPEMDKAADKRGSKQWTSQPRDNKGRFTKASTTIDVPQDPLPDPQEFETEQDSLASSGTTSTSNPIFIRRPGSTLSDFEIINTSTPPTPFKATPSVSPVKTSFVPPPPQTLPPPSPRTAASTDAMSTEQVAPFHGDKEDENPEDFLRAFFRRMGSSTEAVRKDLPKLLREKIGIGHASWTAFLQAIRDIDTEYIREGVDTWKKEQAEQDAMKSQLQSIQQLLKGSSLTQLQQQLASLNLGNPAQTNSPIRQPNLPQAPSSTSAPPVNQAAKRPPPTPADRTAIRAQLQKYPQHPDTDAGRLAHAAQQADWFKTFGVATRVTESTPFPLRPGTSPVNSGECFTCGFTGHLGRKDGSTCGGRRALHANEQAWRAICSRILRGERAAVTAASVQLVVVDDYGNQWQDVQGNEEGPSA
ncbi:hypothetical protein CVT26_005394, partial [Gymnopilus dilepis]